MQVQSEPRLQSELLERLVFETLLTDISATFVNVPADQADGAIEEAQKGICECLGIEHSSLWQIFQENPARFNLTHLYRHPDLPPPLENMNGVDFFPWAVSKLLRHEIVCIPDVRQAPPEAARDMESWAYFQIKSTLGIPLSVGGGPVFGVLSFDAVRKTRDWPETLVNRMQLIAQVFANALERKNSDRKLRESEARLSLAAHSANAGLWTLNVETGEIWLTHKAQELLGVSQDAALNYEGFIDLVLPEDRGEVRHVVHHALESGEDSSAEYRIKWPDGNVHWMLARGRRHPDSKGQSALLMGIVTDITESKRLEQERAELAGRLLHAQEAERSRIARELHDDLGQSLSLFAVQLHKTSMLLQSKVPGSETLLQELRRKISQIAHRVSTLSHQLHSSELELLGLPAAAKALCREVATQHGVTVECSCQNVPSHFTAEIEICLFRVLQEALNNFVKHSHGTRAEVKLGLAGENLVLRFSDNGIGMDVRRGSIQQGLGLVSMRERMRIVGGAISVRSEPEKGTTIDASVRLQPAKQAATVS